MTVKAFMIPHQLPVQKGKKGLKKSGKVLGKSLALKPIIFDGLSTLLFLII